MINEKNYKSINKNSILRMCLVILFSLLHAECKKRTFNSNQFTTSTASINFERSFPERRKFLLTQIKELSIRSYIGKNADCNSEEEDLMFHFKEFKTNVEDGMQNEMGKLIDLQEKYQEKYKRPLIFGTLDPSDDCSPTTALYNFNVFKSGNFVDTFGFRHTQARVSYPITTTEDHFYDPKIVRFRALILDSEYLRLNEYSDLPQTLTQIQNLWKNPNQGNNETSPQVLNKITLSKLLGAGGYGLVYNWKQAGQSTDSSDATIIKVFKQSISKSKQTDNRVSKVRDACNKSIQIADKCIQFALPKQSMLLYQNSIDQYYYGQLIPTLSNISLNDRMSGLALANSGLILTKDSKDFSKRLNTIGNSIKWLGAQITLLGSLSLSHNDIKPENILYTQNKLPRLADFDLATRCKGSGFNEPIPAGTRVYMPPNLAKLDNTSLSDCTNDIFAMGVSLHQIVFGTIASVANNQAALDLWNSGSLPESIINSWLDLEIDSRDLKLLPESYQLLRKLKLIAQKALSNSPEVRKEALRLTQEIVSSNNIMDQFVEMPN